MKSEEIKISIGIPTFNSSKYLKECIKSVIIHSVVDEIIVSDDGSNQAEVTKIIQIIKKFKSSKNIDIKLIVNKVNKGAYENKLKLIKKAKNNFVYILDSDNLAGKNLDYIVKNNLAKDSDKTYLFQPNTLYQFTKFPKLSKLFSKYINKFVVQFYDKDVLLDKYKVRDSLILNSGNYNLNDFDFDENNLLITNDENSLNLKSKWIFWILNCGNFIVNKNIFEEIASDGLEFDRSIRSVDAIVFSFLWLRSGKEIKIYKDFYHHHRKRIDSVSFSERDSSKKAITYFIKKILYDFV